MGQEKEKGAKSKKKRTKSQASPDTVSALPDQKKPARENTKTMNQTENFSQPAQPPSQNGYSPNGSYLQMPQLPQSPQTGMNLQMFQPYMAPGQFVNPMSGQNTIQTPVNQNQNQSMQGNLTQLILERLDNIDRRLGKLDNIELKVNSMSDKISSLDARITSLETNISDSNRKMVDIEASRSYDTQLYTELETKQKSIETKLSEVQKQKESVTDGFKQLKIENENLSKEVIDLQARSMRDNMLFFGFADEKTPKERENERCDMKILNFCENELSMPNAKENIKIDRAHRIGRYVNGKDRPIVVKFNYYPDKLAVKQKVQDNYRESRQYQVSDQFPKAIQEERKRLVPPLMDARRNNKQAYLSYDKLIVDGRRVTVPSNGQGSVDNS